MARGTDYWNKIGRSTQGYNNNAVNVSFRANELLSVPLDRFASDEVYYCWLQHYSQISLMQLQPITSAIITGIQAKGVNIGTTLTAISAVSIALGVTSVVGSILGITGTLITLVENSQKRQELEAYKVQLTQIAKEAQQLQSVYDDATAKLNSIRLEKILIGGGIGFVATKIFKKKRKNG